MYVSLVVPIVLCIVPVALAFTPPSFIELWTVENYYDPMPWGVQILDVNGDGLADWVISLDNDKSHESTQEVWLNNGKTMVLVGPAHALYRACTCT